MPCRRRVVPRSPACILSSPTTLRLRRPRVASLTTTQPLWFETCIAILLQQHHSFPSTWPLQSQLLSMRSVCVAVPFSVVFLNQLFIPSFFACTSRPITLAFLVARPTSNATSSLGSKTATVTSVSNAKSRSSFTTRTSRCIGISRPTIAQQGHIQILDSIPTTGVGFVKPVGRSTGGRNKTSDGGCHRSQSGSNKAFLRWSQSKMMLLVRPRWNCMWKVIITVQLLLVRPSVISKKP